MPRKLEKKSLNLFDVTSNVKKNGSLFNFSWPSQIKILTSTTVISDSGVSYMQSSNNFSMIARRPLAPVFFLMADLAINFKAPGVKLSST